MIQSASTSKKFASDEIGQSMKEKRQMADQMMAHVQNVSAGDSYVVSVYARSVMSEPQLSRAMFDVGYFAAGHAAAWINGPTADLRPAHRRACRNF
jgi:hypothetical protein